MGNQGMKNWKLTALFAISLMLIAGLFTNAAIARDGSGTASVRWTSTAPAGFGVAGASESVEAVFRSDHTLYEYLGSTGQSLAANGGLLNVPLPAGSRENQLMFSYFVDVNMAGGQVEIRLPSGWTIHTAAEDIFPKDQDADTPAPGITTDAYARYDTALLVEIQERFGDDVGKIIYALNRDGKNVNVVDGTTTVLEGTELEAQTDRASVDASAVTVNLSNSWRSGGELVVILRNVETAIPRSLRHTTDAEGTDADDADTVIGTESHNLPYDNYTISVKSKRSGRLDTLDPVAIDHDGDNRNNDGVPEAADSDKERAALPVIRVGNILGIVLGDPNLGIVGTAPTGDDDNTRAGIQDYGPDRVARNFTITPTTVYEGETNKTFRVTFTAGGPMYAIGENKVEIEVEIPDELRSSAGLTTASAGLTTDNISAIARGPVSPGGRLDVFDLDETAGATGDVVIAAEIVDQPTAVTISLDRIDRGGSITLTYELESDGLMPPRTQVSLILFPEMIQIARFSPLPQLSRQQKMRLLAMV